MEQVAWVPCIPEVHTTVCNRKLPASEEIPVPKMEKVYAQDPPTSQEKHSSIFLCFQHKSSLQFKIYIAQRDGQSLPNI